MEDLLSEASARHGQCRHGFSEDAEHGEQMSDEMSQADVQVDSGQRRSKVKITRSWKFSLSGREVKSNNKTKNRDMGTADASAILPDTCSLCRNLSLCISQVPLWIGVSHI